MNKKIHNQDYKNRPLNTINKGLISLNTWTFEISFPNKYQINVFVNFIFVKFLVSFNTEALNVLSKHAAVNFSNYLINLIIYIAHHFQIETLLHLSLSKKEILVLLDNE